MGKKSLFDDAHEAQEVVPQLKVNEDFARRFEHNKKREELHRLKEKYPEVAARLEAKAFAAAAVDADNSDDDSTSEEEDEGYIPEKTEAQILETILKIRNKDQSIYDKEAKFYSSEEEGEEEGDEAGRKKKEKPMYLKDVVYKEAMDRAAGLATDSDESDDEDRPRKKEKSNVKTYDDEQNELKNAFLQAFEEEAEPEADGEFGGVLKARKKSSASGGGEDDGDDAEGKVQELLDAYFGAGEKQLPEEDKFLRNYILNKGWVEHGEEDEFGEREEEVEEEEDEAAWAAAEAFEAEYNFRFEEPGGGQLVTHPRNIEGTVRKEDDRRKRQRAEKAARKAAEEEERRAELKRLKNLKKAEIEDKLGELQQVAGADAPKAELLDELLAGDFDPEAHDKAMAAAFGDDYYGGGATEDEEDLENDELFNQELEAIAQYETDDDEAKQNTFAGLQKRLKEAEAKGDDDPDAAAARSDIKRLLEEYHKLDYEDHVGGIPTRFRYKEVEPETYGLSLEEILMMDDRELNQIVGLKKVAAPYRQDTRKIRPNYGKLNEWRKEHGVDSRYQQNRGRGRGGGRFGGNNDRREFEKRKRDGGGDGGEERKQERKEERHRPSAEEQRLASFVPPNMKKRDREGGNQDEGSKKKKKKRSVSGGGGEQQQQAGSGLSKAQKKNMKRAAKRAAKRGGGEEGTAA